MKASIFFAQNTFFLLAIMMLDEDYQPRTQKPEARDQCSYHKSGAQRSR
jgi:hypothetical protein